MAVSSSVAVPSLSVEVLREKLYFSPGHPPSNRTGLGYSCFADSSLVYTAFFADFGPLDLGLTYKFCKGLQDHLQTHCDRPVCFFYGESEHSRANSAVLVCAYLIFVLNFTAEQAYGPFIGIQPPFSTFRDAGFCVNTFPLTVLDCARAMRRAVKLGHFNYRGFSLQQYQHLQKLQNGDVSWIVPNKFIAFSGPLTQRRKIGQGVYALSPEQYVPLFKSLGVSCVVRFNDKCYDRKVFTNNGIRHVDLFYEDGGNPSDQILQAFLQLCEQERGAIAVHCKAGLGRTGTNIAAYMIKHYGYTAKETIAWCRLCRPGSIVGPQQQYLASQEERLMAEGAAIIERQRVALPQAVLGVGIDSTLNAPGTPPGSQRRARLLLGGDVCPPILKQSSHDSVGNSSTANTSTSTRSHQENLKIEANLQRPRTSNGPLNVIEGATPVPTSNPQSGAPAGTAAGSSNALGARRSLSAVRQYRNSNGEAVPDKPGSRAGRDGDNNMASVAGMSEDKRTHQSSEFTSFAASGSKKLVAMPPIENGSGSNKHRPRSSSSSAAARRSLLSAGRR